MFKQLYLDQSTTPGYVVVTVIDKEHKIKKQIATESDLLAGAIKIEYDLKANDPRINEIAINNDSLEFEFANPNALNNISFDLYNESELIAYKKKINVDSIEMSIRRNPAVNSRLQKRNKNWMFDYTNRARYFGSRKEQMMFVHSLFDIGIRTYNGHPFTNSVCYYSY